MSLRLQTIFRQGPCDSINTASMSFIFYDLEVAQRMPYPVPIREFHSHPHHHHHNILSARQYIILLRTTSYTRRAQTPRTEAEKTAILHFFDIKAHWVVRPLLALSLSSSQQQQQHKQQQQQLKRCPEVIKSVLNYISWMIRIIITF